MLFQNANHDAEEKLDFSSVLDNLSLGDYSDKDVFAQLNSYQINLTESNKDLTVLHYANDVAR